MGNCFQRSCCLGCCYWKCFTIRKLFRKNKTSPETLSDSPSSRLNIGNMLDEQSVHDQLSLFHFGTKSSSGRRYSHPNQIKFVEEYERIKSQPGSPNASPHPDGDEFDYDQEHVNKYLQDQIAESESQENNKDEEITTSVMDYPVVPPGRLL